MLLQGKKIDVESDRAGMHSVSAIYQLHDVDKLFIILEIPFPYLQNGNSGTNTEGRFQECTNVPITIGRQQVPWDVGLYYNYKVKEVIKKASSSRHL